MGTADELAAGFLSIFKHMEFDFTLFTLSEQIPAAIRTGYGVKQILIRRMRFLVGIRTHKNNGHNPHGQ